MDVYLLLNENRLTEIRQDGSFGHEASIEGEEKKLSYDQIVELLSFFSFPPRAKIYLLLGHRWVKMRFTVLPMARPKNIRRILVHHLNNEYIEDIDQLNFDFFSPADKKIQRTDYPLTIYSAEKSIAEKIKSAFNNLHQELVGIYPYFHWLERSFLYKQEKTGKIPDIYIYFFAKRAFIFKYHEGIYEKFSSIAMDPERALTENLERLKRKISVYQIRQDRAFEIITEPRNISAEEFLNGSSKNPEEEEYLQAEIPSFQELQNTHQELKKNKVILNLMRIDNIFLKELLRMKGTVKMISVFIFLSVILFIGGEIIALMNHQKTIDVLNAKKEQLLQIYAPELVNSANALPKLSVKLQREQKKWEIKQKFIARNYISSMLLRHLAFIKKKIPSVIIEKLEYEKRIIKIIGTVEDIPQYTLFQKQLERRLKKYDLKIQQKPFQQKIRFTANLTEKKSS